MPCYYNNLFGSNHLLLARPAGMARITIKILTQSWRMHGRLQVLQLGIFPYVLCVLLCHHFRRCFRLS